jgi:hypothetical protein
MAITSIITATVSAVAAGEATEFTATGAFWLFGDNFGPGESATVERANVAGTGFVPATNKAGVISVSDRPNTIYVDLPAGDYRLSKTASAVAAAVGWESA